MNSNRAADPHVRTEPLGEFPADRSPNMGLREAQPQLAPKRYRLRYYCLHLPSTLLSKRSVTRQKVR
jgi:hypothetical protein